jgi:hypothetical protein
VEIPLTGFDRKVWMMTNVALSAVATGDIRDSSDFSNSRRRELPSTLQRAYERSVSELDLPGETRFSITRGDAWQLYVERPEESLHFLLHFLTDLLAAQSALQSRASLAIDTVDFLAESAVTESDGDAFRKSGQNLEKMNDNRWFECTISAELPISYNICGEALGEFVDLILQDMTSKQAQAVSGMLRVITRSGSGGDTTQKWLAENWDPEPIKQPTLSQHLKSGHWPRIIRQLTRFRRLLNQSQVETT